MEKFATVYHKEVRRILRKERKRDEESALVLLLANLD